MNKHKLKYVRLYEEYTELDEKSLNAHYSWSDVRDVIQLKMPFIILDFKSKESMNECIESELFNEKYKKQTFYRSDSDELDKRIPYPSIFVFGEETDLTNRVKGFHTRFDLFRVMIGEYGKEIPQLFVENEQVDGHRELFSSLDIEDMGIDNFYKIDSMYYTFVNG